MKNPKTGVIMVPLYYVDLKTHVKKYSFIMRCEHCTIFQNKFYKQCEHEGVCKFSKIYDGLNKEYSEMQRQRTLKIMMSGYFRPRD
ncbi:MAG: hypothetical protein IJ638_03455 [Alphaproteobacteria bacterium]|nr:hypothetical protein [Alphaproteobacteria bacterium]